MAANNLRNEESEESLLKELKSTFGYEGFKSDLQKKAVLAVYQGKTCTMDKCGCRGNGWFEA
jgi:hypothetical protein